MGHRAADGGFLNALAAEDLGTPYPDRRNLEVGKGDWLAVNPRRLAELFAGFDPKRIRPTFEKFVEYVARHPDAPRVRATGLDLADTAAGALSELKACVQALGQGSGLVFRLLPPPA